MAVPTFVAVGSVVKAISGTINVPWPSHVKDDIGVLIIETAGITTSGVVDSVSLSGGLGWTSITNTRTSGNDPTRLQTYFRRASSGTQPTVPIAKPTNNHSIQACILTIRGCTTTETPVNVSTTTINPIGSVQADCFGVTTTRNECLFVHALAGGNTLILLGVPIAIDLGANASLINITQRMFSTHDVAASNQDRFMGAVTADALTAGIIPNTPHRWVNGATGFASESCTATIAFQPALPSPVFVVPFTPDQEGYNNKVDTQLISVPVDGGLSRIRQDMLRSVHVIDCQWILKASEYSQFMGYFRTQLFTGEQDFLLDIITDIGIPTRHKVRTLGGVPKLIRQSGDAYWVTCTLECDKNPTTTGLITYNEGGLIEFLTSAPPTLDEGFEAGDGIRIVGSKGIHPTGSTPLNLDGEYTISSVTDDAIQLLNPQTVNSDWSVLAALGTGMQYGDAANGNVISTVTRIPTLT